MTLSDFLRCPVCGGGLFREGKSLYCHPREGGRVHCFDLSASGYADLSHRRGGGGDPRDAVADRTAFLDAGYYAPLADRICELADRYIPRGGLIIDAGCGEGYYPERLAARRTADFVFGADLSRSAVDHASRRRRARGGDNSFYAVASLFSLPVADGSASGVLCMFSPVAEKEILRVLAPGGVLIVGSAGAGHLMGLKRAVYSTVYDNETRADLPVGMCPAECIRVTYNIRLESKADIMRLFGMTPYRFRTSADDLARLESIGTLETAVDVEFRVYTK